MAQDSDSDTIDAGTAPQSASGRAESARQFDITQQIEAARAQGFTDLEIANHILATENGQAARAAGFTPAQVLEHVGLSGVAKATGFSWEGTAEPLPAQQPPAPLAAIAQGASQGGLPALEAMVAAAKEGDLRISGQPTGVPAQSSSIFGLLGMGLGGRPEGVPLGAVFEPERSLWHQGSNWWDAGGKPVGYQPSVYEQALPQYAASLKQQQQANPITSLLGQIGGSAATLGPVEAGTAGALRSMGPLGEMLAGGSPELLPRLLGGVREGAQAGALSTGLTDEPIGSNTAVGAAVGGALGAAGQPLIESMLPRIRPEVASAAQRAAELGVNLRPGQLAESPVGQGIDRVLAGTRQGTGQLEQFTRALTHTIGEDSPVLTDEVWQRSMDRNRQTFNSVARNTRIDGNDRQLASDIAGIEQDAIRALPPDAPELKRVQKQIGNIRDDMLTGGISGEGFQKYTQKNGLLQPLTSDPVTSSYGYRLNQALRDGLMRASPPDQVAALQQAKQEYRNLIALEPLKDDAQPSGVIDPRKAARAFADQPGTLGELGDVGRFLPGVQPQGGAKPFSHGVATRAGLGAAIGTGAAGAALEFHEPIMQFLAGHYGLGVGALGTLGGAMAAKSVAKQMLGSDFYRNAALRKALGLGNDATPLSALLVPGANLTRTPPAGSGQ